MGFFPKDRDLTETPEEVLIEVDGSFFQEKAAGFLMRLDHFLAAHLTWRSRTSIQALVRDGYVFLDAATPDHPQGTGVRKVERRPGRRVGQGTKVIVVIPEDLRLPVYDGNAQPLDILYEGGGVIAVNKPANVAVHPSGRHHTDTLIQRVHAHFKDEIQSLGEAPRLGHRLDRETSGVVLVGKGQADHRELRRQFEAHLVDKTYLAVVWGNPEQDDGSIRFPIAPSTASHIRLKMAVRGDGVEARTDFVVRERMGNYALLECRLFTGRQHQIRLHLSAIGYPIVGDKLYGPDDEMFIHAAERRLTEADYALLELPRQALHHHRIAFNSPGDGERVVVQSPLAADLQAFVESKMG
ncbi:MAG: 23S rRNA pseudouridine1911/1915/1917 synthase [Planctomycetota bacterium]|jgi:23S rRNA pseudouridine1911/1915/1917 synthase